MTDTATEMVQSWAADPTNTARSVLVTIFGDTILPTSYNIWLAQLFKLTDVFGFNGRLVRTSMFRLAAEGWFTNERVGRQSRYSLTPLAIEESEQAAKRIYHSPHPDWSGQWTVVFLDTPAIADPVRDQMAQHLRWHGFVRLSRGVLGSPNATLENARDLCRLIEPDNQVPLAALEFSDLEAVVTSGFFNETLAIGTMEKSYAEFVHRYDPLVSQQLSCAPSEAFALRTMMIHDLRRIRLRSPDVPAALLPTNWPGTTAHTLATHLYPKFSAVAGPWLTDVLGQDYPTKLNDRFAS